ncbi:MULTISPECIES: sortase domain-bontaining protein [Micrococcaceae]|uniref:Sortase domain-bontaining protein n=1 Tax=Arthrobacter sedimenti TaxID=2694931 RepID=A0ABV8WIB2_9MICC|nr:sortase [Pseudarthrobacter defluvii]WJH23790.1 class F sortase [Pseudarthrobacter defluvii]
MSFLNSGSRRSLRAPAAAGLLLLLTLAGCGTTPGTSDAGPAAATATASSSAPTPSAAAAHPQTPSPSSPAAATAPTAAEPPVLPRSEPAVLDIAVIGLRTELLSLGLRANGSLEVPEDTGNGAPASWYNGSPTPGERGPAVLLGHVNALGGHKGVFADLRTLTPGAEVKVTRADGSTATFVVERGAVYGKDNFPTVEVYGNTPGSELRLITCDGYDAATGLFDDNYVVFAKLKA